MDESLDLVNREVREMMEYLHTEARRHFGGGAVVEFTYRLVLGPGGAFVGLNRALVTNGHGRTYWEHTCSLEVFSVAAINEALGALRSEPLP